MKIEHHKDVFKINDELTELLSYVNSFKIILKYTAKFPHAKPSEEEGKEDETVYLSGTKTINTKTLNGLLESLNRGKDFEGFELGSGITFELGLYGGHIAIVNIECNKPIELIERGIELDIKSAESVYIERGTREKLTLTDYFQSKTARKFKQALKLARLVE